MLERKRSLLSAFYILFLDNFGLAITFPIFPALLLHEQFGMLESVSSEGARNLYLGLLLAAFPFAQFFGAPFFGNLADRWGRKKTLAWTLIATIIGYTLTALAIALRNYPLLFCSRLFTGFFAGNLAISMAVIADLNPGKIERGKALSLVAAMLGISWILAIVIGALFMEPGRIDPAYPFGVIALLSVSSLIILLKVYRESAPLNSDRPLSLLKGAKDILHILDFKQLRVLYLTLFFWFFGLFIALQWAIPLTIEKYSVTEFQIMWFFLLFGLFWTLSSGFLNRWLIQHSSLWKLTLWSLFWVSLFFFFAGVSDYFFYFVACFTIAGIFAAMAWGNSVSLISLAATPENQGKSLGIAQSVLALAQFLGPLFGGIIAGFSIEPVFYICALLVFIAFLCLLTYVLKRKSGLLGS